MDEMIWNWPISKVRRITTTHQTDIQNILFLCRGNSARSKMAEGLFRKKVEFRIEVSSAGTKPLATNPFAETVMNEIGIDISQNESKSLGELVQRTFDWVITLCDHAKEESPIFPGRRIEYWDIPEPDTLQSFRNVRDDLSTRIDSLLEHISSLTTVQS